MTHWSLSCSACGSRAVVDDEEPPTHCPGCGALAVSDAVDTDDTDSISVTIQIDSDASRDEVMDAESTLRDAGITFDTSTVVGSGIRDWEFDWSLTGATVIPRFRRSSPQPAKGFIGPCENDCEGMIVVSSEGRRCNQCGESP